jgi:hypothetical protein
VCSSDLYADIASKSQAIPLFESLYGLSLECLRTADHALVVSPRFNRREVA